MKRSIIAAAAAAVFLTALAGCGNRESTPPAVTTAPAPVPPAPPPPTMAAQHETALVGMGARLADDGLYVTVPADEFGGKKGDEFMPKDPARLDRVAGLLHERPELHAVITGYTDGKGKKAANEQLSKRLAEGVRDDLVSRNHVDTSRLEVKGAGGSAEGEQGRHVVVQIVNAEGKYDSRAAMGVQPSGG